MAAKNIGAFGDLYSRINNLFDRRIDGVRVNALNKTFPDATKESTFNLNYNHKTAAGQKFKFSTTSKKDTSKVGKSALVTTGKVAAEPLFVDRDLGLELNLSIAKKDDRKAIEISEKYTKIDNVAIVGTFKVDKHQSVGVKVAYDSPKFFVSAEVTRAFDWYLFANFETVKPVDAKGQTDLAVEGLAALDGDKRWLAGVAANAQLKGGDFTFQNATVGVSHKASDVQTTGFARVDVEKDKAVEAGLNVFWEVEKDVAFAAEAVVRPRAKSSEELFDYTVGASFPFSEGTLSGKFGLNGYLGTNYTQALSSRSKFSVGASFDTLDLSNSAYSLTLTLDA